MRRFKATRKDGKTEYRTAYTIDEFPMQNVSRETFSVKLSRKKSLTYNEAFGAFDIESSTYIEGDDHKGYMYIWQMTFDDIDVYGRTWNEFIQFLCNLRAYLNGQKIIFYIHNLGFEYQFMYQFLNSSFGEIDVFATQKRKVLTLRLRNGIEFRCSWKLSNMSLNKATLNELGCPYLKAVGDLDYSIERTPETELNDEEFGYCMMDTVSLYHYIKAKMKNEGDNLHTIPLTSTSYVRRECRSRCKADKEYIKSYLKQPLTKSVYTLLKEEARGGDTGANFRLAGQEIADVGSSDVASSYPYQQLTQKFPSTRFYPYGEISTPEEMDEKCENGDFAYLFRVAFKNLKMKTDCVDLYLPFSKALIIEGKTKVANGRVMFAPSISYCLTDIDWKIVRDCYTFDECTFTDVHRSRYDYLPKALRDCILDYFKQKCSLKIRLKQLEKEGKKDSEEYDNTEYLYLKSKNRLNGIFGMCYTDPVHKIIVHEDNGTWSETIPPIAEALEDTAKQSNSFLVYAHGVWTTAHARMHLHKLIEITGEGTIYWDTDSSKFIVTKEIMEELERANSHIRDICRERGAYCEIGDTPANTRTFYLGVYEYEETYKVFKTLGAKKYAYIDQKDKLHVTISGVAKSSDPLLPDGARELKTIDNFKVGFTFKEAGGITLYYHHEPIHDIIRHGCKIHTASGIGTSDSTYQIGLTKEYASILGIDITSEL